MRASVTFEYDPNDPEEVKQIADMQKVEKYKLVFWNFMEHLRAEVKYGSHSVEENEFYTKMQARFLEIVRDEGLDID